MAPKKKDYGVTKNGTPREKPTKSQQLKAKLRKNNQVAKSDPIKGETSTEKQQAALLALQNEINYDDTSSAHYEAAKGIIYGEEEKMGKGGRPSVVTEKVVAKLERYFAMGLNDLEACYKAKISKDALYNYIKRNPEFGEWRTMLRSRPDICARLNIINAIEMGDTELSRWWAERRLKNEFSTRSEVMQVENAYIPTEKDLEDEYEDFDTSEANYSRYTDKGQESE